MSSIDKDTMGSQSPYWPPYLNQVYRELFSGEEDKEADE